MTKFKCGCETWVQGKVFYYVPCKLRERCMVWKTVVDESLKRKNTLIIRRE